jgi:hypothetical protein
MDGALSDSLSSFSKFSSVIVNNYSAIVVKTSLTDSDRDGRSLSLLLDNIILPPLKVMLAESQCKSSRCGKMHAQVVFPSKPRPP